LSLAARSVRRRRLTVRRAVIIGGTLGLISPVVSLFVAAFLTPLTLPLLRGGHWAGAILFYAPGGVALGAVAVAIAYMKKGGLKTALYKGGPAEAGPHDGTFRSRTGR